MDIYSRLKTGFMELVESHGWEEESIKVNVRTLKAEEAIGNPEDRDYPIIKGRESMIEALFHGAQGQAFTDMPGDFSGTLKQVTNMDLASNKERAIFIAALNAVMRHTSQAEKTIHCRDDAPPVCGRELREYIARKYGKPRIAMVGLQPRMVQNLAEGFDIRVTDMDDDNIGQVKFGVPIESPDKTAENIEWCDLAVVTGSTLANASVTDILSEKPTIYYGVTVAGPAAMLKLERFCPLGT